MHVHSLPRVANLSCTVGEKCVYSSPGRLKGKEFWICMCEGQGALDVCVCVRVCVCWLADIVYQTLGGVARAEM